MTEGVPISQAAISPAKRQAALLMSPQQIVAHFDEIFPDRVALGWTFEIEHMEPYAARARLPQDARNIRPGGSISGPAMFHLADYAIWVLIIGMLGKSGVDAVTSNLAMTYLRKPTGDLVARVRITKLGRRLTMADVEIHRQGEAEMVAHATATYAMAEV